MTNPVHGISGIRLRVISATPVFVFVLLLVASQSAQTQTFSVLYTFEGGTDGGEPLGGLVQDGEGNLYGTAAVGGDLGCNSSSVPPGCGIVFKVSTSGQKTLLHAFSGGTDGANPQADLVWDPAGNLYSTTAYGGDPNCPNNPAGCGTVFKLNKYRKETVLYSFTGGTDGEYPQAGLVMDPTGNFLGVTYDGGASGFGTVFKLNKYRKETVLYSFTGGTDGGYPSSAYLVVDEAGNLYGTTSSGGAYNFGTVFKLNKYRKETVLYSFTGGADGGYPGGTLLRDTAGNLYGTTEGTVFKLTKTGKLTTLHTFTGPPDGSEPNTLVRDSAGNLYGTTNEGGDSNCLEGFGCGMVFKLATTGKETVLYTFMGSTDGQNPTSLIRDAAGNLYGTTLNGGDLQASCNFSSHFPGCGVVFKIVP
jgi:uncharacterized repeat protein (TIGR03803 family)